VSGDGEGPGLDREVAEAHLQTLAQFARAIVRVMRKEGRPCDRETAYELMSDLWESAKKSELGAALVPQDETFAQAFDHDTRELFWALVRAEHRNQAASN